MDIRDEIKRRKLPRRGKGKLSSFFRGLKCFGAEASEVNWMSSKGPSIGHSFWSHVPGRARRALLPLGRLFLLLSGFLLRHNAITSFLGKQMYASKNIASTVFYKIVG
jgi:hypothetical protein